MDNDNLTPQLKELIKNEILNWRAKNIISEKLCNRLILLYFPGNSIADSSITVNNKVRFRLLRYKNKYRFIQSKIK